MCPDGLSTGRTLVWRDRSNVPSRSSPARAYMGAQLSPDGSRVAVSIEAATSDVWVYHIAQGTLTRLTFEGDNAQAFWSPDGTRLAYAARGDKTSNLFWVPADGSGPPERLTQNDRAQMPTGFSPDGRFLVSRRRRRISKRVWLFRDGPDRRPVRSFGPLRGKWARVSPMGSGSPGFR